MRGPLHLEGGAVLYRRHVPGRLLLPLTRVSPLSLAAAHPRGRDPWISEWRTSQMPSAAEGQGPSPRRSFRTGRLTNDRWRICPQKGDATEDEHPYVLLVVLRFLVPW